MSDPLIEANDLATYLNDDKINVARAELMIAQAQALCESIISPLPTIASVIVLRIAARGYVTTTQSRRTQMQAAGSPYGAGGEGGIRLWPEDEDDLRRLNGGTGGVFSVDILPVGYVAPVDRHGSDFDQIPS